MRNRTRLQLLLLQILFVFACNVFSHGTKLVYTPHAQNGRKVSLTSIGFDTTKNTTYIFDVKTASNFKNNTDVTSAIIEFNRGGQIDLTVLITADAVALYKGEVKDGLILDKYDRLHDFEFLKAEEYTDFWFKWELNVFKFGKQKVPGELELLDYVDSNRNLYFDTIDISSKGISGLWSFQYDKVCDKYIDVVVVLDSSSSLSVEEFDLTKIFARNIVSGLKIESQKARFASYAFGNDVKEITGLLNHNETIVKMLLDGYNKHTNKSGIILTRTHLAILKVVEVLTQNRRPSVPQVGIVVTDGKATSNVLVQEAANTAAAAGITLLAVGTGPISGFLTTTLALITGGNEDLIFQAGDYFDELNIATLFVLDSVCNIAIDEIPTSTVSVDGPADIVLSFEYCPADPHDLFHDFQDFLSDLKDELKLGEIDVNLRAGSYCSNFRTITSVDDFTGSNIENVMTALPQKRMILVLYVASYNDDTELNELIKGLEERYGDHLIVLAIGFTHHLETSSQVETLRQKLKSLTKDINNDKYLLLTTSQLVNGGYMQLLNMINSNAAQYPGETSVRTWVDKNANFFTSSSYTNIQASIRLLELEMAKMSKFGPFHLDYVQREALKNVMNLQIQKADHYVDNANTHLAIAELRHALSSSSLKAELDASGLGGGPTRKVGVIFTDGPPKDPYLTALEANKAAEEGIELFAVGIGNDVSSADLEMIAKDKTMILTSPDTQLTDFKNMLGPDIFAMSFAIDSSNSVTENVLTMVKVFLLRYYVSLAMVDRSTTKVGISIYNDWVHRYFTPQQITRTNLNTNTADIGKLQHLKNYPATHEAINTLVHMLASSDTGKRYGVIITDHVSSPKSGPGSFSYELIEQAVKKATANGITLIPISLHSDDSELLAIAGMDNSRIIRVPDAAMLTTNVVLDQLLTKLDKNVPKNIIVAMPNSQNYETEIKAFVQRFIDYAKSSVSNIENYDINMYGHDFATDVTGFRKHNPAYAKALVQTAKPPVPGNEFLDQAIIDFNKLLFDKQKSSVVPKVGVLVTNGKSDLQNLYKTYENVRISSRLGVDLLVMGIGGMSMLPNLPQIGFDKSFQAQDMNEFKTQGLEWLIQRLKGDVCDKYIDVAIAIDSSSSLSPGNFTALKSFAKDIGYGLAIASGKADFAAVAFGTDVKDITIFDDDLSVIVSKLDDHTRDISGAVQLTNTHLAIDRLTNILVSHRKNVPKLGIIITDGKSTNVNALKNAADIAASQNINFLAVGVGTDGFVRQELKYISHNNDKNVFESADFQDGLSAKSEEVLSRICELAVTEPTTTTATPSPTTTTPHTTTSSTTTASTTTTTPGTTTESITTTRAVTLADRCEQECKVDKLHSFVPHESSCRHFWQCTRDTEQSEWTIYYNECPYNLFWNQESLSCDWTFNTSCIMDPCKNMQNGERYELKHRCHAFYTCIDGRSIYQNCPKGYLFNSVTGSCDIPSTDSTCRESTVKPPSKTDECKFETDPSDVSKFIDKTDPSRKITQSCPFGTLFYQNNCVCDIPRTLADQDKILDTAGLGAGCGPSIGERDGPQSTLGRLESDNPTDIAPGETKQLSVTANMDFGSSVAIVFDIFPTSIPTSGMVTVLENCPSDVESTIRIRISNSGVEAKINLNQMHEILTVPAKYNLKNNWSTIRYYFDGDKDQNNPSKTGKFVLQLIENGDKTEAVKQKNGTIPTCNSPLTIGSKDGNFAGKIRKLSIYDCVPDFLKNRK